MSKIMFMDEEYSGINDLESPKILVDESASSGDDYDIKQAITSLGWSDVLSGGILAVKKLIAKVLKNTEIKKLVWTNPSTGSFSAQTISLDLSNYDCVEVEFYSSGTSDVMTPNPVRVVKNNTSSILYLHGLLSAGVNETTGGRNISMSSTGVTFTNYTYKNRRSGGSLTTANQFSVPRKIYGIKLVG